MEKRVLIFVDDLSATGVVKNAIAIAGALSARGADVRLVTARAEGTLKATMPNGVELVGLLDGKRLMASRRIRQIRAVRSYRRYVGSVRPDVIFSAGNHAHLASIAAASAAPDARLIFRISNDLEHAIGGKPVSKLGRWWRAANFRRIVRRADKLVFVSQHLLDQAMRVVDVAETSAVIQNGVDLEAIRKRAAEECAHPWLAGERSIPVVLAVGRLVQQKNLLGLVRAVAVASANRPLRLLLIGSGRLCQPILTEGRSLDVPIDIIPSTENPMPYMARASVVALPSWWEGSSNVLLEAMACGTPVVASRTAGSAAEVLDGGRYGVLVDPSDVREMADALTRQCGSAPVRPDDRALDFRRDAMLQAYTELILGEPA